MRWIAPLLGTLVSLTAALGLLARYVSPQVFWPPAVVGLLVPGLLLLTGLFLLFFLTRRRRWKYAVLPLLVLAFSIPVLDKLFVWPRGAAPTPSDGVPTLTVVTGNQRLFREANKKFVDTAQVAQTFGNFGADVLLLQEIWPASHAPNYIRAIQTDTGLTVRHQVDNSLIATYASELTPVLSSFAPPHAYNGYLVTDVQTALGELRFINAHLVSNQISGMTDGIRSNNKLSDRVETFAHMLEGYGQATRQRARQAEEIRALVEASPHPVILGGDFNDVPSSYTYQQISSPRLRDAWVMRGAGFGSTFTGPLPGLRIDYFLVDTSLTVVDIERLPSHWSDHRPLRITITE